ncbi:MAG: DUF2914 domain-containing protein [Bradymonadaceae bacterium]
MTDVSTEVSPAQIREPLPEPTRREIYWQRVKRWAPLSLFVGGFLFDVVTLGAEINPKALLAVCGYALVVPFFFVMRAKSWAMNYQRWFTGALHLAIGSLFSALAVLYFRSAGQFFTSIIVIALFTAMVWNEFARRDDSQRELLWGIYCVSLVMLFNFLWPYIIGSVRPLWFYVSTLSAVGLIWGLKVVARVPVKTVRTATAIAALLAVLYPLGWIPPVPLVMENSLVGTSFKRADGEYTVTVEPQGLVTRIGLKTPTLHRAGREPVYVLTAISAPKRATAELEHRWQHKGPDGWTTTDVMSIKISGGRQRGWRAYSFKRNMQPGRWKVQTALVGGAILGSENFELVEVDGDIVIERRPENL